MAPPEFVAFDLETTGLSPRSDRIVEIGAVRFDAEMRRLGELEVLVDPGVPIPLPVQRLCGITDADVAGQPSPTEGVAMLADFCAGAELVAHGSGFDIAFCAALVPDAFAGRRVLDTLEVARVLLPTSPSHSLPLLSIALGHEHIRPHRALSDASATHLLFSHLRARGAALPVPVLGEMRRVAAAGASELASFLGDVVPGDGDAAATTWNGAPPPPPAATASPPSPPDLEAAATAVFAPGGPLDRDGAGFEVRDAQVQMARAVAQSLRRGRHLLVEAGTGVGKSLAYLVPVALHARDGRRAVVSTRTVTLQEQLVSREVPLVERLVGAPLNVAMLKGRSHYLSLRRWQRFLHAPLGAHPDVDRLRFTLKVLAWLAETTTGDRAELHLGGNDMNWWRLVQSENDDCLGSACANWRTARCYMVAARRRAADAAIVVTNHSLLLADATSSGQVLGDYEALVVDEAHHLEEVATEQLGTTLRAADVHLVVDRLPVARGALAATLDAVREGATRLLGDVKGRIGEVLGSDQPGNATVALTDAARDDPGLTTLHRSAQHAVVTWRDAAGRLRAVDADLDDALFPQPDRAADERELAAQALEAHALAVERILLRPRPGHVCWLASKAENGELHEAPIEVAGRLRETVFAGPAVVATSATLAVNGDFSFVAGRLGLVGADELVLGSPYDFLEQALCILPTDVPPYDDEMYDEVLASITGDLAIALGGGTLALFTGYSPLRRIHALLSTRLGPFGIALLGQGLDGTRRQVLGSFLANRRSLLLGTSTFWEGVDVPGDALQCVVIAKLPFAVPTDPLVRARTAGLADPFGAYILPQAVLRLRQGFGRLIRRGTDRGVVVLCDERLSSREYGDRFLRALPPAAMVRAAPMDVGAIARAFVVDRELPAGARIVAEAGQSPQAMESFDPA